LFKQNENHNVYDESTGVWWLVYVENEGMFCVLCRSHNTVSPTNGDGTWNSKPCVRNITQAIKLHANSAMHEAAINKEHLQRASPFHKEVQERETVKNEVLVKVFSTLYWLAKEEIANKKATSLLALLERLGLEEMRHFPNLVKLSAVAQSLPVTNAWPERGASALKRIKTRLRNSLKDDMLGALLQVSINGPSVSEAKEVVEQAIDLWLDEKQRRKLPKVTASTSNTRENSEVVQGTELVDDLTAEVDFLNDEIQDLEDELYTQEQVFKKLLANMCTATDDGSDCESDDD